MESITAFFDILVGFIWGPFLLIPLLLGTGIFLTILLRGLQFSQLGPALHLAFVKRKEATEEGDISHYQALTAALSGTVGTGNVVGVATAISLGGPGALFWMWITALFGMATKYSEAVLGVKYRETDRAGEKAGGPMFYLSNGIGGPVGRVLGVSFAIFAAIAAFGIGNTVQSNATASYVDAAFGVPVWITGIVLTVGAGAVILGGIRAIGTFTGYFVPFMMVFYVVGGLIVLLVNITAIPAAIWTVVSTAFTGTAATGGFAGVGVAAAIQFGVARGIFSNESGLGTGGIAAASAKTVAPVRQGVVSMTQTFIDTIVICSITGLAIVTTGVWSEGLDDDLLTQAAFAQGLGGFGPTVVTLGLAFFSFSTLITWAYYGERNIVYLFGRGGVLPYRLLFIVAIFIGAIVSLDLVWSFATAMNGLMALPNLIGLLLLSGVVWREMRGYFARTGGTLEADMDGGEGARRRVR
jgi:AGCS family alanine or glycine:cation symporter